MDVLRHKKGRETIFFFFSEENGRKEKGKLKVKISGNFKS